MKSKLRVKKVWVTPQGKTGVSYINEQEYGLTLGEFKSIKEQLLKPWKSPKKDYKFKTNHALVVISDLHTGAVVKACSDVLKTEEFNIDILRKYLDDIVDNINSKAYHKVTIAIPGDIIESFTAFNHKDTWKSIQYYQGEIVIIVHELLQQFLSRINNLESVYMIEGNHDRLTADKWSNSRKGIVNIVTHFLNKTGNVKVHYHPFIKTFEIDGVNYIMTHGDLKPWKGSSNTMDKFLFKYGKQDKFNVLITGHYHSFSILGSDKDYMHISCPSLFTGNFFSESIGYNNPPGYLILTEYYGQAKIEYLPCKQYEN